jgi:hypothetical protein
VSRVPLPEWAGQKALAASVAELSKATATCRSLKYRLSVSRTACFVAASLALTMADRVAAEGAANSTGRLGTNVPSSTKAPIVGRVTKHFGYAIDKRYLPVLLPFLLRPGRDGVTLTDEGELMATFGIFKIATHLSNVTGAHITRNYRWWTAFGVRMSRVDDGLTFGTNHDGGVCIHFAKKVPSPLRRSGHSALTVTVADLEALTTVLGGDEKGSLSREPE